MSTPGEWSQSGDHLDDFDLLPFEEGDDDFAAFLELLGPDAPILSPCNTGDAHVETDPLQRTPIPPARSPEADLTQVDLDAARLERIRAKNRRGQAKYREKLKVLHHGFQCRFDPPTRITFLIKDIHDLTRSCIQREKQVLEASIDQAKSRLTDSNTRYRALRDGRAAAVARVNSATAELDRFASCLPPASHSDRTDECTIAPPPHAPMAEPAQINQALPRTGPASSRPRRPSTIIPIFGHNAGIYASVDQPVRDISSYSQCCAISLSDVFAHVPAGSDVLGSRDVPQHIPQAIREHQAAVSAALGTPREEICWFVEMPHTVATGLPLSHTASMASTPCRISLMVFGEALTLEAGMLLEQHAALVLDSTADTSTNSRSVPAEDAEETTATVHACQSLPLVPDAAVCNQQLVRCGVNQTCTITEAVEGVVVTIIRRYRRKLSRAAWRVVCSKAMLKAVASYRAVQHGAAAHAAAGELSSRCGSNATCAGDPQRADSWDEAGGTHASRDSTMQPRAGQPASASAGSNPETACSTEGSDAAEEGWTDDCRAMYATFAAVAHALWSELQADTAPEPDGTEQGSSRREEIEARMLDVNMAPAVSCVMLFQQAPHTVRQLCQDASCFGAELEQVERHQRRLLRSLDLQPEQRAHCAQIWRQWYKKRRMLDREFEDAVDAITGRIPQMTDVPAAFVKLLDCLAQTPGQPGQPQTRECGVNYSDHLLKQLLLLSEKLVGVTGTSTEGSAAVLRALKAVHVTDGLLYEHFLFLTVMPSWYLTQVQHTQLHASMLDEGVSLVDNLRLCRAAAQEERWKEVFTSLHF